MTDNKEWNWNTPGTTLALIAAVRNFSRIIAATNLADLANEDDWNLAVYIQKLNGDYPLETWGRESHD